MGLQIGDLVKLNSGGPPMTVVAVDQTVLFECMWWNENRYCFETEWFHILTLKQLEILKPEEG